MPTCALWRVDGRSVCGDGGRAALGELLRLLWAVDSGEGGVRVHSTPVAAVCEAGGEAQSHGFATRDTFFRFPAGARRQCGHRNAHRSSRSASA